LHSGGDAHQIGAGVLLAHGHNASAKAFDLAGDADGFDSLDSFEAAAGLDVPGDKFIGRLGMGGCAAETNKGERRNNA
jgi:hypothetical protein